MEKMVFLGGLLAVGQEKPTRTVMNADLKAIY
jgi:hypothetical protein